MYKNLILIILCFSLVVGCSQSVSSDMLSDASNIIIAIENRMVSIEPLSEKEEQLFERFHYNYLQNPEKLNDDEQMLGILVYSAKLNHHSYILNINNEQVKSNAFEEYISVINQLEENFNITIP